MLTLDRLTREYVFWDITTENNLAGATVEVAFLDDPTGRPAEIDWNDAVLVEITGPPTTWRIRILVGPEHVDAVDLTPGSTDSVDYQTWARITSNPERIVRRPGVVTIL